MQNWNQSYKRKVLFSWCILKEGSFDLISDYAWEITLQNKKENELPRAISLAWELTTKINPWPTLFSLTLAWNSICRCRWSKLWRRLKRALLLTYLAVPSLRCSVDWASILGIRWEPIAICFNKLLGCWNQANIIRVGINRRQRWRITVASLTSDWIVKPDRLKYSTTNTTGSGKYQWYWNIRIKDT